MHFYAAMGLPGQHEHQQALLAMCYDLDIALSVVDVVHSRTGGRLGLEEVDVMLTVETRGPDHRGSVLDALGAAGYAVHVEN